MVTGCRTPVLGGRVTEPPADDDFSGPGPGLRRNRNTDSDPARWALNGGTFRLEGRPGPEDPRPRGNMPARRRLPGGPRCPGGRDARVGAMPAPLADGAAGHTTFGGFTVTAESGDTTQRAQRGREQ
ncbi:hypothetical protein GCM10010517_56680 [Streptosporangium fragile]|uniref:Uncharacterized protein n=1 Tax=Streptosporangium fragile TaxID=46186 RepID=A0ABN3W3J5_9ACTN